LFSGGNSGNRFAIELRTGELSARALDRETQARYNLVIVAQDGPGLRGLCNLTVSVEDENDNRPEFGRNGYTGTVREDALPGTPVLTVTATDPDLGPNARLVYSIANETHWLFAIDNRTGLITTVGYVGYLNIIIPYVFILWVAQSYRMFHTQKLLLITYNKILMIMS
jgi:protocadherin-16/23